MGSNNNNNQSKEISLAGLAVCRLISPVVLASLFNNQSQMIKELVGQLRSKTNDGEVGLPIGHRAPGQHQVRNMGQDKTAAKWQHFRPDCVSRMVRPNHSTLTGRPRVLIYRTREKKKAFVITTRFDLVVGCWMGGSQSIGHLGPGSDQTQRQKKKQTKEEEKEELTRAD